MLDDSNGIVGGFAMVPNYCLRDKRLTPTDKGIYAYICSNSPTFICSEKNLANNLGVGSQMISSSINRLKGLGYVTKVQHRGKKGRFGHDLRHSCATLLLAHEVPMKLIQEWLGHSDIGTTANIYSHTDYKTKMVSANIMVDTLSFPKVANSGKK